MTSRKNIRTKSVRSAVARPAAPEVEDPAFIKHDGDKPRFDLIDPEWLAVLWRDTVLKTCPWLSPVLRFWAGSAETLGEDRQHLLAAYYALDPDLDPKDASSNGVSGVQRVLEFGAKKYAAHNWRKPCEWYRYYNAIIRHALKIHAGEEVDADSGEMHIYCVGCSLMFLWWHSCYRPEGDTSRWHSPSATGELG